MKICLQFLSITLLTVFIFACSNTQEKAQNDSETAQTEEIKKPQRPKYDFRKTRWGMSRQEVMDSERAKLIFENENSVEYRVFVGDYQAQANYKFQDDKLIRAGLYFLKEYDDKNDYLTAYEILKESMVKNLGSPLIDKSVQLDPSQVIDTGQQAQAVCDGKIVYGSQWNYPGTDVQLLLRGEDGTCYLTIMYIKNLPEGFEDETKPEEDSKG